MSFMQFYLDPMLKMKSMEQTSLDHLQNFSKGKKSMKLNQSSDIDDKEEDINIL